MPNWASLVRLLRRRLVLGIIFVLSLTYCAISLLSNQTLENSLRRTDFQGEDYNNMLADNPVADSHENGEDEMFRGAAKHLAWQLEMDNNYDNANEDSLDNANPMSDSNGTQIVGKMCRNSVQGKALIVDERGFVCARSEVLPTGCCMTMLEKNKDDETNGDSRLSNKRRKYSCETCNPEGCCAVYEYCVSCCLQPGKRRGKKDGKSVVDKERRDTSKTRRGEDALKLRLRTLDRFQICLAACRTSSASVRHENTYKDPDTKHCYSHYQRPRRDESLFKNNNGDNTVVVVTSSSTLRLLILSQSSLSPFHRQFYRETSAVAVFVLFPTFRQPMHFFFT